MMEPIKCQCCNKKPAIVHVTEILDGGERKEVHLCDDCAREKKIGLPDTVTIPEILSNLVEFYTDKGTATLDHTSCPRCGISYQEFRAKGRLGCAHDYTVFKEALTPLLQRVHQGTQHKGKMPPVTGREVDRNLQLAQLRRQLDEAVEREDYEKAAELRDSIRNLTEKQDNES